MSRPASQDHYRAKDKPLAGRVGSIELLGGSELAWLAGKSGSATYWIGSEYDIGSHASRAFLVGVATKILLDDLLRGPCS